MATNYFGPSLLTLLLLPLMSRPVCAPLPALLRLPLSLPFTPPHATAAPALNPRTPASAPRDGCGREGGVSEREGSRKEDGLRSRLRKVGGSGVAASREGLRGRGEEDQGREEEGKRGSDWTFRSEEDPQVEEGAGEGEGKGRGPEEEDVRVINVVSFTHRAGESEIEPCQGAFSGVPAAPQLDRENNASMPLLLPWHSLQAVAVSCLLATWQKVPCTHNTTTHMPDSRLTPVPSKFHAVSPTNISGASYLHRNSPLICSATCTQV